MTNDIPFPKLFKLAFITSPLFGIMGSAPIFALNQLEFSKVASGFLVISVINLVFWSINILLLRFFERYTFRNSHWIRYIVSIITCSVLLVIIFQLFVVKIIQGMPDDLPIQPALKEIPRLRFIMPVVQAFSINLFVIILTEIALLRDRKQKIETENTILRLANLEARHSQLKQQLHPHFLFNSLNILNSLIRKNPAQAEEYLVKLSELLRFSIYSNKQATVSLAQELELSIHYLNMQKVRFNEALGVSITVDTALQQQGYVPVYSIQLLIENAIKHNILTVQKPLHISITGDNKMNTVTVANNMQPKPTVEEESGVGLSNLAERYRLLGNKPIDIIKDEHKFSVTINVLENENSNN
jgi:two-component system, LytTR family, sensor kinase